MGVRECSTSPHTHTHTQHTKICTKIEFSIRLLMVEMKHYKMNVLRLHKQRITFSFRFTFMFNYVYERVPMYVCAQEYRYLNCLEVTDPWCWSYRWL